MRADIAKRGKLLTVTLVVAMLFTPLAAAETTDAQLESHRMTVRKPTAPLQTKAAESAFALKFGIVLQADDLALKTVEVVATGYYAGPESTGKDENHPGYGVTYSGVRVRRGAVSTIAADPRVFPIGSLLYIPGYGYGLVADIGAAIKGNKIDLFFETKSEVYAKWGKKTVNVLLIKKGDGKATENMLDMLNKAFATNVENSVEM